MEKENQNREQKRKNNLKKTEILQRRWEMYGWVPKNVAEKAKKCEEQWLVKEHEKQEEMESRILQ